MEGKELERPKRLTVKELKEFLNQFPDDMEVVETRCSDYGPMDLTSWSKIKVIDVLRRRGYYMSADYYQYMSPNDYILTSPKYGVHVISREEMEVLHYQGN